MGFAIRMKNKTWSYNGNRELETRIAYPALESSMTTEVSGPFQMLSKPLIELRKYLNLFKEFLEIFDQLGFS